MTERKKDTRKVSAEQFSLLLEALEKDSSLISSKNFDNQGKYIYFEKWDALGAKLNSMKDGARKTGRKWQQTWRDWKSNIKKKVGKERLTAMEERIMKIGEEDPAPTLESSKEVDISYKSKADPLSADEDQNSQISLINEKPSLHTVVIGDCQVSESGKRNKSMNRNSVKLKRRRKRMFLEDSD